MGNYDELKQAIAAVIKTNGNQEITGEVMQNALLSIISTVGNYATFAGIATPETNPGTPDQNVFWLAPFEGVYVNFNGIIIGESEIAIILNRDNKWIKYDTYIYQKIGSYSQINISDTITGKVLDYNIDIKSGTKIFAKWKFGRIDSGQKATIVLHYTDGTSGFVFPDVTPSLPSGKYIATAAKDVNNIVIGYKDGYSGTLDIDVKLTLNDFIIGNAEDISANTVDVQELNTDVQELNTDVKELNTDVQELNTDVKELSRNSQINISDTITGKVLDYNIDIKSGTKIFAKWKFGRIDSGQKATIVLHYTDGTSGFVFPDVTPSLPSGKYIATAAKDVNNIVIGYKDGYSGTLDIDVKLTLNDFIIGNAEDISANTVDVQENEYKNNVLRKPFNIGVGKTLLAFGDSITYGYTSVSSESFANEGGYKYIQVLANNLGMTLRNYAVSGATATDCTSMSRNWLYNQINNVPVGEADVIMVAIGINDFDVNNANLGTLEDVAGDNTFYAALKKCYNLIKSKWQNAQVIALTPINYLGNNDRENPLYKYRNAVFECATINGFSVIAGQTIPFPTERGLYSNILLADNLHPTSLGYKFIGDCLSGIIL